MMLLEEQVRKQFFSLVHLLHLPQLEMAPGKNLQNELIHSKELPLFTSTVCRL